MQYSMEELALMQEAYLSVCNECGTERIKISPEKMPKKEIEEFGSTSGIEYFLHCPTCDSYSAFGKTHYGGSQFERQKFKSSPSLNSPCPCNSGKKYKRCCGLKK